MRMRLHLRVSGQIRSGLGKRKKRELTLNNRLLRSFSFGELIVHKSFTEYQCDLLKLLIYLERCPR